MNQQQTRGRTFFYGIFIALAVATFFLVRSFLSVIAVALVTIVMLKPLYDYLMSRRWVRGRVRLATGLSLLAFLIVIIVPVLIIGTITISQLISLVEEVSSIDFAAALEDFLAVVEDLSQELTGLRSLDINGEQVIAALRSLVNAFLNWLAGIAVSLGTSLPALFANVIIFLALVVTLLPAYDDLIRRFQELSPLDVNISDLYLRKGTVMISSMVKGIFLLAILQGLIMGVFYWLAGVPFAFVLCLLSIVMAVLPAVGISFIVLPLAVIFLLTGDVGSALIVLFGFYVVVNPLDILLRPRLVSKEVYLNFALILLAIFGGLSLAGVLGLIYGPVIMILFLTTIEIYGEYFARPDEPVSETDNTQLQELPDGPAEVLEEPT